MKTATVIGLLLLACGALASANEIAFVDTYQKALESAMAKNQKLLITFYADW